MNQGSSPVVNNGVEGLKGSRRFREDLLYTDIQNRETTQGLDKTGNRGAVNFTCKLEVYIGGNMTQLLK